MVEIGKRKMIRGYMYPAQLCTGDHQALQTASHLWNNIDMDEVTLRLLGYNPTSLTSDVFFILKARQWQVGQLFRY